MGSILTKISGEISGRIDLQIYYEDTDMSGFVYHSNYLKYFERAREHVIGVQFLSQLFDEGVHFVVNKAELSYIYPAKHGNTVAIVSSGKYSRSPVISFDQTAHLVENGEITKTLVKGTVSIVALNNKNRPIPMPQNIVDHFLANGNAF